LARARPPVVKTLSEKGAGWNSASSNGNNVLCRKGSYCLLIQQIDQLLSCSRKIKATDWHLAGKSLSS
jgi:hypothetical protein